MSLSNTWTWRWKSILHLWVRLSKICRFNSVNIAVTPGNLAYSKNLNAYADPHLSRNLYQKLARNIWHKFISISCTKTTLRPITLHGSCHVSDSFCAGIELCSVAYQKQTCTRLTNTRASFWYKMTCSSFHFDLLHLRMVRSIPRLALDGASLLTCLHTDCVDNRLIFYVTVSCSVKITRSSSSVSPDGVPRSVDMLLLLHCTTSWFYHTWLWSSPVRQNCVVNTFLYGVQENMTSKHGRMQCWTSVISSWPFK